MLIPGPDDASPDHVVADLGDLTMNNSYSDGDEDEGSDPSSQAFVCSISKMHMRTVCGGEVIKLLHNVKLDVVVIDAKESLQVSKY